MKMASCLLLALACGIPRAKAQELSSVAVFPAAAQDGALRELATALDPVLLGELGELAGVDVTARPPLDLPATQLALDCIGETTPCLRAVARQASVDVLVAPSVERAGDETVVTLLYFDARGDGSLRSAVRRHRGPRVEAAAFDALPAMLRELFGRAQAPPRSQPASDSSTAVAASPAEASDLPAVSLVLAASGVALIGAGVAFGLMSEATEEDYAAIAIRSERDVDAARSELDSARTQALLANLGIGVGAALIAAGAVSWFVVRHEGKAAATSVAPRLGPHGVGLEVRGRFGEAP